MRWLAVAVLLVGGVAHARSQRTVDYTRAEVWPTAVRFIRVDENLKVTDKDADAGYVLFQLREEHKTFRGALELIDTTREGRPAVRLVITLDDRPAWEEIEMLDGLTRKLREDLGAPPPAPPAHEHKNQHHHDGADKPGPKPSPPDDDGPPISPTP